MILSFVDIDIADNVNAKDTDTIKGYVDSSGNPLPYVESITIINGASEIIHLRNEYEPYLLVSDTTYGKNTKYSAIIISFNENLGFKIIGD